MSRAIVRVKIHTFTKTINKSEYTNFTNNFKDVNNFSQFIRRSVGKFEFNKEITLRDEEQKVIYLFTTYKITISKMLQSRNMFQIFITVDTTENYTISHEEIVEIYRMLFSAK